MTFLTMFNGWSPPQPTYLVGRFPSYYVGSLSTRISVKLAIFALLVALLHRQNEECQALETLVNLTST